VIRTRFAPSPTGSLHVGNARIAVLNWLFTRRHGGQLVLRIEDTDAGRNVTGSERRICEDLAWLGLHWDEGPECGAVPASGAYGPYRQSERRHLHRQYADRLRADGAAYPCYCTSDELEARRTQAVRKGRPARYDGRCRDLTASDRLRLEAEGRTPALRVRVDAVAIEVRDVVRGTIRFPTDEIGDFIILRSDGEATYNFAVVVDDIAMRITHVIRGAGHLSNTPRQVVLHARLGVEPPQFAHVPTVLGPDRRKLSKRHGAQALADYRAAGYHPDGVLNYLSLLAWSSSSGEEVLTREQLVAEASLERVGTADVIFDPVKLRWLSGRHIEKMPLDALVAAVRPFAERAGYALDDALLSVAVAAVRSHLQTFGDIGEQLAAFHPATMGAPATGEERALAAPAYAALAEADWTEAGLSAAVAEIGRRAGVRGRALYVPLRRILTGRDHGPPFGALLQVQGRERVLAALAAARSEPDRTAARSNDTTQAG
jgi:glutamyl-tRNA synthetase